MVRSGECVPASCGKVRLPAFVVMRSLNVEAGTKLLKFYFVRSCSEGKVAAPHRCIARKVGTLDALTEECPAVKGNSSVQLLASSTFSNSPSKEDRTQNGLSVRDDPHGYTTRVLYPVGSNRMTSQANLANTSAIVQPPPLCLSKVGKQQNCLNPHPRALTPPRASCNKIIPHLVGPDTDSSGSNHKKEISRKISHPRPASQKAKIHYACASTQVPAYLHIENLEIFRSAGRNLKTTGKKLGYHCISILPCSCFLSAFWMHVAHVFHA